MPLDQITPRGTDWEKDGVGIYEADALIIRDPKDTGLCYSASIEDWYDAMANKHEMERRVMDAEHAANHREPSRFIDSVLAELEKRAKEADSARDNTTAGRVMSGMALAYRDAAALIRGQIE